MPIWKDVVVDLEDTEPFLAGAVETGFEGVKVFAGEPGTSNWTFYPYWRVLSITKTAHEPVDAPKPPIAMERHF